MKRGPKQTRLKRKGNRLTADLPDGSLPSGKPISCFRCGLCCTRYQAPLTATEAEAIAADLRMPLDVFLDRYVDDRWYEPGRFLLDTDSGGCVFLEPASDGTPPEGGALSRCRIHPLRPQVCRDYQPGLHQRECLEGLEQHWGLAASPSGKLLGPDGDVRRFRDFLRSLAG